jgi:hypothetical protein
MAQQKQPGVFDGDSTHESRERDRGFRRGDGAHDGVSDGAEAVHASLSAAAQLAGLEVTAMEVLLGDPRIAAKVMTLLKKEAAKTQPRTVTVPAKDCGALASSTKAALAAKGIEMSCYLPDIARLSCTVGAKPQKFAVMTLRQDGIALDRAVSETFAAAGYERNHRAFLAFIANPLHKGIWVSHGPCGEGESVLVAASPEQSQRNVTLMYTVSERHGMLDTVAQTNSWHAGPTYVAFKEIVE